MNHRYAIAVSCFLVSLFVCGRQPSKRDSAAPPTGKQNTTATVKAGVEPKSVSVLSSDALFDRIARFISGMVPDSADSFSALRNTEAWKQYQKTTDAKWNRFNKYNLQHLRQWAGSGFAEARKGKKVFYLFSGPDVLYVTSFFPSGEQYILFGLEPSGKVPDPQNLPPDSLAGFLEAVNQSLDDVFSLSFFKTMDMRVDLKEGKLRGNIPVLMYLMARTGHRILDMKPIHVDTGGVVVYSDSFYAAPAGYYNHGVEIRFHRSGSDTIQSLIYFAVNISDYGVKENKNVRRFLQKLDTSLTTYIKAASYLMHKKYFSNIRQSILTKSRAILQDDSGIPYKLFDPLIWNITLFGTYTQPIDLFKEYFEQDLKDAYELGAKPIGVRLGYGAQSNLLYAVRKKR